MPKFYAGDLAPITYTMGSGSEIPANPLANLKNYDPREYWLGPTGTADFNLNIDLGANMTPNAIVLDNINLGVWTQNLILRLQYDNNNNGAYSAVTSVLSLDYTGFTYDPQAFSFTGSSKRYWRLKWEKNTDSFQPKLGQVFLRKAFDFGQYELPAKVKNERFSVNKAEAIDGTTRRTLLYPGRYTWELEFKLLSDTQKADFLLFMNKVAGPGYGFYFYDNSSLLWYCYFDLDYMPVTERMYNLNDIAALRFSAFLPSNQQTNLLTW